MTKNLPALFSESGEIKFYEVNGEFCLTAEDIGKGLGYSDPANSIHNIYSRYKDELEQYSLSIKLIESAPATRVFTEALYPTWFR